MIVDAHQHFWKLARGDYAFPRADDPVLYRDFAPADLAPLLAAAGVGATVLVQATDTLEETAHLLAVAEEATFVAGVVGWWDPHFPGALDLLDAMPNREALVGVRPMLQRFDDVSWLITPDAIAGLSRIAGAHLVFDALVDVRHLETIRQVCAAVEGLTVVVDHMGKPWRYPGRLEEWVAGMMQLAAMPNCRVKVSGYPFSAGQDEGQMRMPELVALLKESFGPSRLLWGSDWPVVEREGGYAAAISLMAAEFAAAERDAVFRENAIATYRLAAAASSHSRRAGTLD